MKRLTRPNNQHGFTLFELLISLALVLVVILSVQRYISGVTIDQEGISARHDQITQLRIVLSNMQRDVAQAGFFPYGSTMSEPSLPVGVSISSDFLKISSYQPFDQAKDCNGASRQYSSSSEKWVYVENTYKISSDHSLGCDGNGGNTGLRAVIDNVVQMSVTNANQTQLINLISVCIITSGSNINIGGIPTTTLCDNRNPTPNLPQTIYYKIRADMPIYASSFMAGE